VRPPPHFHAEYQGQQGIFEFSGQPLVGNVKSGTALRLIREWAAAHRSQLEANWARVALAKVKDDLSRYLRMAESEEIVITRHGRPAGYLQEQAET
jgi:prevent-host-death family protein